MALLLNAGDTVSRSYSYTQPSPLHPSQPSETGERTGNLLDYTTVENTTNATATQISSGISVSGRYYVRFRTVKFTVGSTYTMSWKANTISGTSAPVWRFRYADNTYSSMPSSGGALVVEKEVSELLLYVSTTESCVVDFTEIMLNTSSTALPYEPYGYKIPISSAGQTTPVYLGEVQTTRRIKKLVLDGTEDWGTYASVSNAYRVSTSSIGMNRMSGTSGYSTHYVRVTSTSELVSGTFNFGASYFYICDDNCTSKDDFKTYLAQQYVAGTPVCVWYVLAEPETGILNEPIRKIGEYADTVSGITIPTIAGTNAVDVLTTLKPSEVTVNYHGWHPVSAVHERESGAWT